MHLKWRRRRDLWVARSHAGTEARIYPHPNGAQDVFVVEANLGGKTYARGADARGALRSSQDPAKSRRDILAMLKESAEGYVMRFETTGIQDPIAADAAIVRMEGREWGRRIEGWWARNRPETSPPPRHTANDAPRVSEPRAVALRFHIDTNRINARRKLPAMNRLEHWRQNGVIEILMPEPAADEAMHGRDAARLRKAQSYIQGLTMAQTAGEKRMLQRIEQAIFPGGADGPSQRRDVEIVFNAHKYGGYLVTADGASKRQPGGILGARGRLTSMGVKIITDEEACELVQGRVRARDERARREAAELGISLPSWVGRDA